MILYHATDSTETAEAIVADGFKGNRVWDMSDVVFLADKPLQGFSKGWGEPTWVTVEVPTDALASGLYDGKDWDDDQYHAACYAFTADVANTWPREMYTETDADDMAAYL